MPHSQLGVCYLSPFFGIRRVACHSYTYTTQWTALVKEQCMVVHSKGTG